MSQTFSDNILLIGGKKGLPDLYIVFYIGLKGEKSNIYRFVELSTVNTPEIIIEDEPTILISFHGKEADVTKHLFPIMREITNKDFKDLIKDNLDELQFDYDNLANKVSIIINNLESNSKYIVKVTNRFGRLDYVVTKEGWNLFGNTMEEIGMTVSLLDNIISLAYIRAAEEKKEELKITLSDFTEKTIKGFKLKKEKGKINLENLNPNSFLISKDFKKFKKEIGEETKVIFPLTKYGIATYEESKKLCLQEYLTYDTIFGQKENYLDALHYSKHPEDIQVKTLEIIKRDDSGEILGSLHYRIWKALTTKKKE